MFASFSQLALPEMEKKFMCYFFYSYGLSEYMLTPFKRKEMEQATPAMEEFQKVVTSARSCVELVNSQLKGRWRYVF